MNAEVTARVEAIRRACDGILSGALPATGAVFDSLGRLVDDARSWQAGTPREDAA